MEQKRTAARLRWRTGIAALLLSLALPLSAAAAEDETKIENVEVSIDGEIVEMSAPVQIVDDRLFFPIASLASLFGAAVEWDQPNETLTIQTANGDRLVMTNEVPVVYFNEQRYLMDAAPFLTEGRMYVPVRFAAGFMGSDVVWHAGEALAAFESDAEEDAAIDFPVAEPYAEEDYLLLSKLVQVEAGYESYEGQLAVANVILNRVKDTRFPDSIRGVIYSGKQFPPAHNGLLDKSEPNASVLRATKDALNGRNNVEGAVYFFNPKVTKGAFWDRLEVVATFDNHSFAK